MENKTNHLQMIQSVISRMGGNLFLLKGWSVTLIVALFALADKSITKESVMFSYCILLIFWLLDGYFLSVERCYIDLYNDVRIKTETQIDFAMDYRSYKKGRNTWARSIFSFTLLIFYGALLLVMTIALFNSRIKSISLNIDWNDKNIQTSLQSSVVTSTIKN